MSRRRQRFGGGSELPAAGGFPTRKWWRDRRGGSSRRSTGFGFWRKRTDARTGARWVPGFLRRLAPVKPASRISLGDPLATRDDSLVGQLGLNPRCAVRAPAPFVNRTNPLGENAVRLAPAGPAAFQPGVEPAPGDAEHAGHRHNGELSPVRSHEPEDPSVPSPERTKPLLYQYLPLFPQPPNVTAQTPQLRPLRSRQAVSAAAFVAVRLSHSVGDRLR